MKNTRLYQKVKERHTYRSSTIKNSCIAFLSGGLVGLFGELIIEVFCSYGISRADASTYMIVIFIFLGIITTAVLS